MQSKYRNIKTEINGIKFDSKKEGRRYLDLCWFKKANLIKDLELQKKFELQESFKLEGKTYQSINYICDFFYFDIKKKRWVVEDVKSPGTLLKESYRIKRKLFLKKYGKDYIFIDRV